MFYYLSAFEIMIERRVWPLVRGSAFEIMIERRVWPLVRGCAFETVPDKMWWSLMSTLVGNGRGGLWSLYEPPFENLGLFKSNFWLSYD